MTRKINHNDQQKNESWMKNRHIHPTKKSYPISGIQKLCPRFMKNKYKSHNIPHQWDPETITVIHENKYM